MLRNGKVSRAKMEEKMGKQVCRVTWHPDEQNAALVAETVRTLELSWFLDGWEEKMFGPDGLNDWFTNLHVLQGDIWILDAQQLLLARDMGIVNKLPSLHLDDINDRNKGDAFVKLVATAQIVWFVVQIVVRLRNHLPTTQLKIMTFSFALSTAITFALLLNKPKDLAYTTEVPGWREPITPQNLARLALFGPSYWIADRTSVWIPNHTVHLDFGKGSRFGDRDWTCYLTSDSPAWSLDRLIASLGTFTFQPSLSGSCGMSALFSQHSLCPFGWSSSVYSWGFGDCWVKFGVLRLRSGNRQGT
jgi:hypothetical protein